MKAKVGVYVCECGPNIADKVDLDKILETLPALEEYGDIELVVKRYGLLCSADGKNYLEEEIKSNGFTHLVLGACSPRDHNKTFIEVCKKTDLNPYLYKIINIREHCAWIIPDKEKATEKAISYLRGGINRVLYQSSLFEKQLDIDPDVVVIGGGIAGMETALSLAGENRNISLIEKSEKIGGRSAGFSRLLPRQGEGQALIEEKIEKVNSNPFIRVFLESELESIIGFLGNFEIVIKSKDGNTDIKAGAIVVAAGYDLFDPLSSESHSYSEKEEVYTSLEIEKMFKEHGKIMMRSGKEPASVALVHCVGREEKGYCSRICCNYMIKIAGYLKGQSEAIKVTEFHRGLCMPDKADQSFKKEIVERGVEFIRTQGVTQDGTKISFTGMDGSVENTDFDMVILAPAMIPGEDTDSLAELLEIPISETGFFQEMHQTTDPVATSIDGVFVVGTAHSPKGITDSILFAQAAAGRILTHLIPGEKIVPEVKVTEVLEAFCTGCQNCLDVCVYGAIYYDESKGVSVVNEVVCRGCGNCFGSCPSGALRTKHFTNTQLYQEVREAIR